MAVTPQSSLKASFDNLAKAQDVNFRQRLDARGELVKSTLSGGLKGRLVACVENGRVSKGSVADRIIRCAVGGARRYDAIAGELRQNKEASVRNFTGMLTRDLRLDNELARAVARKVEQGLGSRRITTQAGADLARDVAGMVAQRRADRQETANRVLDRENWTMTPAMVTNEDGKYSEPGYYEALLAHAAIREDALAAHEGLLPEIATMDRTAGPERRSNAVHRADRMLKEMRAVQQSLLNPPQLLALKNERNDLLAPENARGPQDKMVAETTRLNELETEIAGFSEDAAARADEFRSAYMEMLAAIAASKHHGAEDSAYFPLPEEVAGNEVVERQPGAGRAGNKSNLRGSGKGRATAPDAQKRRVAWSDTPVQAKDYGLRQGEAGYEGDPQKADLKSYNQALRVPKSKDSLGLEDTGEVIGAMQPGELSPSDERELIRAFDMLQGTLESYEKEQNRLGEGQQNRLQEDAERARELLRNPLLQTPQVIGFIEKQVYGAPAGAAPGARGRPTRTALRSASLDRAVGILTRVVNGADAQQQPRAAGLLRTILQDALHADPPLNATSRRTLETKLSRLDADWPVSVDWTSMDKAEQTGRFIEAARDGIDAARDILENRILDRDGNTHSIDEVAALLNAGDGGLRRLTTALRTLSAGLVRPQDLPAATLNGLRGPGDPDAVRQWTEQSDKIKQLAATIDAASYNEDVPGAFTQFGTTGDHAAYRPVREKFPQHDQGVRAWLKRGHELTERLLVAQEGAGKGARPLDEAQMAELQQAVREFAGAAGRPSYRERTSARIRQEIQQREQEISGNELQYARALQGGEPAPAATTRFLDGNEPLAAEIAELEQLGELAGNGADVHNYLDDRIERMGQEAAVLQAEQSPMAPSLQAQIDLLTRIRDSLAGQ
ncbi:MAG: hypothetical protein OXS28_06705 [Gammaproteobacteria bacterium]|nr:hypothetical protein [Gammaproteobacteria bacterium]